MNKIVSTHGVQVQSDTACILYDQKTGAIRHRHRSLVLVGGREPTQAEIEKDAITYAGRMGLDTDALKVLHVETDAISVPGLYRIDLQTAKPILVRPMPRLGQTPIRRLPTPSITSEKL